MKNKIIVSSILTIALCLSMIAGSTFALFTSESKVDIAVTSGTLDVDAVINNDLQLSSLGVAQTDTFANGGTATLTGEKLTLANVTPGDKATFSITVTNNSNVAMNYRFVWSVEGDLYPFLTATVDGVALVNNSTPYTLWTGADTQTFQVVVELPQGVGNDAQNKTANISFKVEAVQGNVEIVEGIEYRTNENGQKVLYDVFGETPSVVTVPEGVEVIGNWSLYDATFEEINLPSTLKTIGNRAFKGNTALKSVTIPAGTETIVEGAFQQSSLESATINGGSIGKQAFGYISTLETVILGENVSYVENYAFRGCASLKTVIILNENIEFGGTAMAFSNAESGKSDNITIYVPNDEVAAKVRVANGSCTGYTVVVGDDPRVDNAEDLKDAIVNGGDVILTDDVVVDSSVTTMPDGSTNEAYGNKVGVVQYGGVLDGDGNTISSTNGGYVVVTHGGTIKNLVVNSGDRGIVTYAPTEDVIIDNVIVDGPGYGINSTEYGNVDIIVTNSTVNGWTSLAGFNHAYFTNCKLGENTAKVWQGYGYSRDYDRLFRPYCNATLTNCELEEGYYIDLSALGADCEIVLDNCTVNGVVLTADNYASYITIELPSGRTLADCVVFR